MYTYELLNNHYVVTINGEKFLLDTGRPDSSCLNRPRDIEIDGMHKSIVAGYHPGTINFPIGINGIILIGNITTLFDEVCVIDLKNRRLILK